MSLSIWILVTIAGILAILGAVFIWELRKKNWHHETDYKSFFVMGIIWVIIGGIMMVVRNDYTLSGLFSLGLIFTIVGLANKSKWGKKQTMTAEQRKWTIVAISAGLVALIIGFFAFLLFI